MSRPAAAEVNSMFILRAGFLVELQGRLGVYPVEQVRGRREEFQVGPWVYGRDTKAISAGAPPIVDAWDPGHKPTAEQLTKMRRMDEVVTRFRQAKRTVKIIDKALGTAMARGLERIDVRLTWHGYQDLLILKRLDPERFTYAICAERPPLRHYRHFPLQLVETKNIIWGLNDRNWCDEILIDIVVPGF